MWQVSSYLNFSSRLHEPAFLLLTGNWGKHDNATAIVLALFGVIVFAALDPVLDRPSGITLATGSVRLARHRMINQSALSQSGEKHAKGSFPARLQQEVY